MTYGAVLFLWRFRPRRPLALWWRYVQWRLETYSGMPAKEVTWQTVLSLRRQPHHRQAFWRYARWLRQMSRCRGH